MLYLDIQAPFAAFRTFSAGSFRPTAPFMTYSAAYGLLLNLAGVEMRWDDGKSVITDIKNGLPEMRIALGEVAEPPQRHVLYQQLHNYPVGPQGKERAPLTKGGKYNIVPARRAFLSGLRACLGVEANRKLESAIVDGLNGQGLKRYGLPFLGDNNFLPDRIQVCERPIPARWLIPIEDSEEPVTEPMRLTITIDRADMSKTKSRLYRFTGDRSDSIPTEAWVDIDYG